MKTKNKKIKGIQCKWKMNEQWIGICPNGLAPGVSNKCFFAYL